MLILGIETATEQVSVAIGGPGPSSGGSSSTDFRNLVVNRDEYANDWTNAVTLSPGQPVYGSSSASRCGTRSLGNSVPADGPLAAQLRDSSLSG